MSKSQIVVLVVTLVKIVLVIVEAIFKIRKNQWALVLQASGPTPT
jgi:regulator of protease activity HflC (stomatin/prohibitin superfamily)